MQLYVTEPKDYRKTSLCRSVLKPFRAHRFYLHLIAKRERNVRGGKKELYIQTVYTNSHSISTHLFNLQKDWIRTHTWNMNTITRLGGASNIALSALGATAGLSDGVQLQWRPSTARRKDNYHGKSGHAETETSSAAQCKRERQVKVVQNSCNKVLIQRLCPRMESSMATVWPETAIHFTLFFILQDWN